MNRKWIVKPNNEKIMEVSDKYWMRNIPKKDIPPPESVHYHDFYDYQLELCRNGVTVDGVFFPGVLYWHLNFWTTDVDYIDEFGNPYSGQGLCTLRDTEWIIFNAIHEAEKMRPGIGRKGLAVGGGRRIAKTTFVSSYLGHGITTDFNSQNVLATINSDDMDVTVNKVRTGIRNLPEAYQYTQINRKGWSDHSEVQFGIRGKDAEIDVFSQFIMRNLDNGNKEETIAGTKPKRLVIEEGAKGRFLKGLISAKPGFTTRFGMACSPIVIFTGGDAERFEDAKSLFFSPEAYDFLTFEEEYGGKGRKHGLFLGETYRQEAKEKTTMGHYLEIEDKKSPLYEMDIDVSVPHKAREITDREIENLIKEGKHEEAIKTSMYFPRTVDEIFQTSKTTKYSNYNGKLTSRLNKLQYDNNHGMQVELEEDEDGNIIWEYSEKLPILDLDVHQDRLDAPITIFEHPMKDPPDFLYVAGVDPYRQSGSLQGSLGVVYIYKRTSGLYGEQYRECIVAKYIARTADRGDWDRNAELLIRYYNAYALVENDELGFIDHMRYRDLAEKHLSPQPELQKRVNPNTSLNRPYGVSRSPERMRTHLDRQYGRYLGQDIYEYYEGEQTEENKRTLTGLDTIPCALLLRQTIIYDGETNTDAVIAFQLALAMARELDTLLGVDDQLKATKLKEALSEKGNHRSRRRSFKGGRNSSFGTRKRLFKL